MPIKPRSAKNKGYSFQKQIASELLELFPELKPEEIVSAPSSIAGEDIMLSENARKKLSNTNFELKRQETASIWAWLEQAEAESRKLKTNPILIFKRNHSKAYATIEFDFLKELLYNNMRYQEILELQTVDLTKLKKIFTEKFLEENLL